MGKKNSARKSGKGRQPRLMDGAKRGAAYTTEQRLKIAKACVEECLPADELARVFGVSQESVYRWAQVYRELGEAGLQRKPRKGSPQLPQAVKDQIVALKQQHPWFGATRLSQVLRRFFLLPASPETVRETLHGHGLIDPAPVKLPRAPAQPRRFERTTPNQMWQADIHIFRLTGHNAYLIGFIDDYSRFLVGLELYRSQSAENVMEVYRRAVTQYGQPREMLTDNGRQFAAWRGKTRFQEELRKAGIHHIRSRPHHPMTLGKIERFWQNLQSEFLNRATLESFESARERIALWVRWYNHRRTHQGIDGLCPADRFFEIRTELRQVVEAGLHENLQELALHGQAQPPFYLVGRVADQSLVVQARDGKLLVTVNHDGERTPGDRVRCDPTTGELTHEHRTQDDPPTAPAIHGPGEVSGDSAAVDGEAQRGGPGPGPGRNLDAAVAVAGPGDGGDARGAGTEAAPLPPSLAPEPAARTTAGPQGPGQSAATTGPGPESGPGEAPGGPSAESTRVVDPVTTPDSGIAPTLPPLTAAEAPACPPASPPDLRAGPPLSPAADGLESASPARPAETVGAPVLSPAFLAEVLRQLMATGALAPYLASAVKPPPVPETALSPEDESHGQRQLRPVPSSQGTPPGRTDHPGPGGADDGGRGGDGTGRLTQDLVRMGGAGAQGDGRGPGRPAHGPAGVGPAGSGEDRVGAAGSGLGETGPAAPDPRPHPGPVREGLPADALTETPGPGPAGQ